MNGRRDSPADLTHQPSQAAFDGRALLRQAVTFGVIGVTATLVHVSVALLLHQRLGVAPLSANFFAYGAAVGVSYFGNARLTFGRRVRNGRQVASFAATSLSALCLSQAIVYLITGVLRAPFPAALALVVLVITPATFVINRLWVFARD